MIFGHELQHLDKLQGQDILPQEESMEERLQKIISARGITSRRKAEELIEKGRVTVNGELAFLGDKADADADEIAIDGKPITESGDKIYIMLNKPRGYVTTAKDERGRKTVMELVKGVGTRVYPVGRLDMASEGLLVFTNDGNFANKLMHPSHQIDKEYVVRVEGDVDAGLTVLLSPMELDGKPIKKPTVNVVEDKGGSGTISIVIHEGRNRQVRRMCEQAGLKVKRLIRVREGELRLGRLRSGEWRYLERDEMELLLR